MWRDLVFALRSFRKAPAFHGIAVLSLVLGVGLVTFAESSRGELSAKVWRLSTVADLAKRDDAFNGVFGRFATTISFSTGDESEWLLGELVTSQYFQTMQVKPSVGRLLTDENVNGAAANPVCVLSYEFWQREFAGDPKAVGRTVFLNGHAYRILGVTARGHRSPG